MNYSEFLRPQEALRVGQAALFNYVVTTTEKEITTILPTGYGKTWAGLGTYLILRGRGVVNRALVLVSSDRLRKHWAKKAKKDVEKLGQTITAALALDDLPAAFRYHQQDKAEIFIATYQQVTFNSKAWIDELTKTGSWLLICDEFHHLTADQAWGKAIEIVPAKSTLYLSATPVRSDKKPTIGGFQYNTESDQWELRADVHISLKEALEETAIRRPIAHNQHYFIDVLPEGETQTIRWTTAKLKQEGIADFSEYEAKKRLRFVGTYLSRMLLDALDLLTVKNIEYPGQHQMLVFAMSCLHAESVATQLNDLAGEPIADWVGVTRSVFENRRIIDNYEANRLKCLVQVDMVNEGFDVDRASVLVFLHLIKSPPKLLQQIGRGLRRNYNLIFANDVCDILTSADSEVAELVKTLCYEMGGIDGKEKQPGEDCDCCAACPLCEHHWQDLPSLEVLSALYEKTERIGPDQSDNSGWAALQRMALESGAPHEIVNDPAWLIEFSRRVGGVKTTPAELQQIDETQMRGLRKAQCTEAAGKIARRFALRHQQETAMEFNKSWIGSFMKQINKRWTDISGGIGHKNGTAEELQQKYKWLQEIDMAHRESKKLPAWLIRPSAVPGSSNQGMRNFSRTLWSTPSNTP